MHTDPTLPRTTHTPALGCPQPRRRTGPGARRHPTERQRWSSGRGLPAGPPLFRLGRRPRGVLVGLQGSTGAT